MVKNFKQIDVIIPFADSFKELRETIISLENQSIYINKLIIVVSGNNVKERFSLVSKKLKNYKSFKKIILLKDEANYRSPGTARNVGLKNCFGDYVGFIDSGMIAHEKWISSFFHKKISIRLGSTLYLPRKGFQTLSAFLTYGTKYSLNSLPGSILRTEKCVNFEESLRFGEDIIWKNNYEKFKNYKLCFPCKYSFFPDSIPKLLRKFYFLNLYSLKNGSNLRNKIYLYSLFSLLIYLGSGILLFFGYTFFSFLTLSIYLLLRFIHKNKISYLFDFNIIFFVLFQVFFDHFRLLIVVFNFIKKIKFKY